jgi:hypothetical protein
MRKVSSKLTILPKRCVDDYWHIRCENATFTQERIFGTGHYPTFLPLKCYAHYDIFSRKILGFGALKSFKQIQGV